jgi:hypothetical protein
MLSPVAGRHAHSPPRRKGPWARADGGVGTMWHLRSAADVLGNHIESSVGGACWSDRKPVAGSGNQRGYPLSGISSNLRPWLSVETPSPVFAHSVEQPVPRRYHGLFDRPIVRNHATYRSGQLSEAERNSFGSFGLPVCYGRVDAAAGGSTIACTMTVGTLSCPRLVTIRSCRSILPRLPSVPAENVTGRTCRAASRSDILN